MILERHVLPLSTTIYHSSLNLPPKLIISRPIIPSRRLRTVRRRRLREPTPKPTRRGLIPETAWRRTVAKSAGRGRGVETRRRRVETAGVCRCSAAAGCRRWRAATRGVPCGLLELLSARVLRLCAQFEAGTYAAASTAPNTTTAIACLASVARATTI